MFAQRHAELGIWCGYVGIPSTHPWWGWNHDDIDRELEESIHGGVTFAQDGDGDKWAVGHYWVGFDCGHGGDLVPQIFQLFCQMAVPMASAGNDVYRRLPYVQGEITSLAAQLRAADILPPPPDTEIPPAEAPLLEEDHLEW